MLPAEVSSQGHYMGREGRRIHGWEKQSHSAKENDQHHSYSRVEKPGGWSYYFFSKTSNKVNTKLPLYFLVTCDFPLFYVIGKRLSTRRNFLFKSW